MPNAWAGFMEQDVEQAWDVQNVAQHMIDEMDAMETQHLEHMEVEDENWIVGISEDFVGGMVGLVGAPIVALAVVVFLLNKGKRGIKTWWKRD